MIVRSERDKAVGEGKSLQQSLTEMTREKQVPQSCDNHTAEVLVT